jgi:basic amino acid/polyamine antiporter, APA family
VATCNALSSAQLAASMPVSGGTYEYGYAYLNPTLGFTAGWMFLCAKTASAATAALGFAGYLLAFGIGAGGAVAVAAVAALTVIVLAGIRRSNTANTAIVSVTLRPSRLCRRRRDHGRRCGGRNRGATFLADGGAATGLLHATALMFVAFTGYARIATLGEEVHDPRRTIPRAILITLVLSAVIYVAVGAVGIATIGADGLAGATQTAAAPLEVAARTFAIPEVRWIVTIGAITAMLGVLLNLILGLSRMLLAMGGGATCPPASPRSTGAGRPPRRSSSSASRSRRWR